MCLTCLQYDTAIFRFYDRYSCRRDLQASVPKENLACVPIEGRVLLRPGSPETDKQLGVYILKPPPGSRMSPQSLKKKVG